MAVAIIKEIKPIFQDLTDTKILEKCLHVVIKNSNKAYIELVSKNILTTKKFLKLQ